MSDNSFKEVGDRDLLVLEKLLQVKEARLNFALNHHRNTHDEPMDFDHYPHVRALYNSTAREMVLMGSVQSFKSEFIVIDHLACAYVGLAVFFVVPKYEMRNTYVQNRVDRCVQNVKEYKRIMGAGFFDSMAIKSFGKGVIKYVGSNVVSDFKEFPADVIVVEEVDECNLDNIEYAIDRLRASRYQFQRYLANPRIKNRGVHKYFMRSDQREWYVPCLGCGEFHETDWFTTVVKDIVDNEGNVIDWKLRDTDWVQGCKRDIKMICPDCGGELDRGSIKGKWVPKNPTATIEGYHLSMLCNMINPIAGMWDRFSRAITDPGLMQRFFNSDLGLPFDAIGNKVTPIMLDNCISQGEDAYSFVVHPDVSHVRGNAHPGPCSMGVDVGSNLDVRISYLRSRGERQAVFIGKVRTIDDLYELIQLYNIEKVVMDSMPEITLAADFQEGAIQYDCEVWLCRYAKEGSDRRRTYDLINRIINADRTEVLDRSFAQIRLKKNLLPTNYAAILAGSYAEEMCMPIRKIVEDTAGNPRYEWSKGKDHQRHADTYDMLASFIMTETTIDEVTIG